MFDSNSDSENTTQNTGILEESSDMQLLAEARGDQLQEDNASLIRQNNILRAQFEQAVSISQKATELHKEIDSLKAQLFECNTQKEDLQNRLEISIKAQNEAQRKLDEEHTRNAAQRKSDVNAMQAELNKIKKSYESKIDKLCAINNKLQQEKDADEIAQKTLVGKIDKMVFNSSHFLNRQISSFEELCTILETETLPAQQVQVQKPLQESQEVVYGQNTKHVCEFQKKAKKAKSELKAALKKLADAQAELQSKNREIDSLNFKYEKDIREINEKLSQVNEDKALGDADKEHKISTLEAKVESLKEELAKKKKSEQPQKVVIEKKPIVAAKKSTEKVEEKPKENKIESDDKFINEQLSSRIEELTAQLASMTQQRDSLKQLYDESEARNNSLITSHQSEHNELQALKTVHAETLNEVETIRIALHAREDNDDKKEASRRRKEQQKTRNAIAQLEDSNEKLKKQAYELQLENENAAQQINDYKDKFTRVESENTELKEQITKLTIDLGEARARISNIVPLTEEDFLPRVAWASHDFEGQLAQQIAKISSNDALHAASKLQQIYRAISKHYAKQIDQIKSVAEESNNDSSRMYSYMNDFIVSLSIALNDKATQFEEFMQNHEIGTALVNRVTALRTTITDLSHSREALQTLVESIGATFGITNCTDIYTKISAIRTEFDTQIAISAKQAKKMKAVKTELSDLKVKYTTENDEKERSISRLKSTLESVNETNARLTETNKKYKMEIADAKRRENDLTTQIEHLEQQHKEETEEANNAHNNQVQAIKQEYTETIDHLTSNLSEANQTITEADAQLQKYKKIISTQKSSIQECKAELQATKQQYEIALKKLSDRSGIEKKQLVDSYEKAIRELTEQSDKQSNDLIRLSEGITKKEKRIKEFKSTIAQLKHDNAKLEKDGKLREEEFARENKIAQTAIKGAAMSAESQYTAKLSEQKTKWEAEKRRILAFVADELRQFFNANEAIDEKSFRSIITKAKEEINRLQRTDAAIRRMVGATCRQTTDDAVAQLVISTK